MLRAVGSRAARRGEGGPQRAGASQRPCRRPILLSPSPPRGVEASRRSAWRFNPVAVPADVDDVVVVDDGKGRRTVLPARAAGALAGQLERVRRAHARDAAGQGGASRACRCRMRSPAGSRRPHARGPGTGPLRPRGRGASSRRDARRSGDTACPAAACGQSRSLVPGRAATASGRRRSQASPAAIAAPSQENPHCRPGAGHWPSVAPARRFGQAALAAAGRGADAVPCIRTLRRRRWMQ